MHIPNNHPRAESLRIREKLVEGFRKGVVVPEGLIAHGRGECFDYLIGEKTQPFAFKAEKVAVALLLLSNHPIISVNGNCVALCPTEIVKLAYLTGSKVEVNLFQNVIAIDLNPFSRTAIWASITIVDNVVRAFPNMIKLAKNLKKENKETLKKILETYDNDKILKEAVKFINQRLVRLGHEKVFGFSLTEEVLQLAKLNPVRLKG
ncbi:MAG: hypothetical protein B6U77_02135 [Candidatus Hecatellales archaeon ex4484_218]|nr:MAG: hypothetical protein B6U77_02135 [Candidatus Hecatellales archaeon ex4484_218]